MLKGRATSSQYETATNTGIGHWSADKLPDVPQRPRLGIPQRCFLGERICRSLKRGTQLVARFRRLYARATWALVHEAEQ